MKNVVNRSNWSFRRKVLEDIGYLSRFLLGQAPRYEGEWSSYFECEPVDPLYGGWTTYCSIVTLLVAFFGSKYLALYVLQDFQLRQWPTGYVVMWTLGTPLAIAIMLIFGFVFAQLAALPFSILNSIFDQTE